MKQPIQLGNGQPAEPIAPVNRNDPVRVQIRKQYAADNRRIAQLKGKTR